ncbi:hypothetical protein SLEP1_g57950 [Rubroshorea leprosula]|uniref:Uncharacterized protein n=1 Tax=Rubroshorea leprosula TaxID=152421 RepID=A0AAV5MSA7_9ROSI|nr:hypothetical protein SLEP1_g57950 [Rubroshorea leprosula]
MLRDVLKFDYELLFEVISEEKVGMVVEVEKKSKKKSSAVTLQHFISTMTPLLDLDKVLSSILFYFLTQSH